MGRSYYTITEDLRDSFLKIYDLWDDKRSEALAMRMLEEDIALFSAFFSKNSKRSIAIAAQCITLLRIYGEVSMSDSQRETVELNVSSAISNDNFHFNIVPNFTVHDVITHSKSWLLVKELREQNRLSSALKRQYQMHCIELIDMFFASTGSLSADDMQKMSEFEHMTMQN